MRQAKYKPYKIYKEQEIFEHDTITRAAFCETMMERGNEDRDYFSRFTLNNEPNTQNYRVWATENPHRRVAVRTQDPQKVNVWAGLLKDHIIGPFFIDGTLAGTKYLELLQEQIVPDITRKKPNLRQFWFQQDGCPAHGCLRMRTYLNETFGGWIGKNGTLKLASSFIRLGPL